MYLRWRKSCPPGLNVVPIQFPGHETRYEEAPSNDMTELVEGLIDGLMPLLEQPFAFFGHSFGAWVAFEAAHALRARGLPEPKRLFLSSIGPSHRKRCFTGPRYTDSDGALANKLRRLGGTPVDILDDPALLQYFLPAFRADLRILEHYSPAARGAINCAISVFSGEADPTLSIADLQKWQPLTRHDIQVAFFPGGHFYLRDHHKTINQIGQDLELCGSRILDPT